MEGDVVRLCDTKHKTCAMTKNDHGDVDVDGLLHKIGNATITHVDEWKACCGGREMEGPEALRARGRMM
jgi:hypothetical protein